MFASLFSLLGVYSTLIEFLDKAREKFLTQPFHSGSNGHFKDLLTGKAQALISPLPTSWEPQHSRRSLLA